MTNDRPNDVDDLARGVRVRRLTGVDRDLPTIVGQINAASMEIETPITPASMAAFLSDERNVYLVAHVDGRFAGALHAVGYVHPNGHRYVYVDEVDTDEAYRRRGVATAMMRAVLAIAAEMRASAVWLGADDGNDAAHALYRSLGAPEREAGVIYTYSVVAPTAPTRV